MQIKLDTNNVEITKDNEKLSFSPSINPERLVIEITSWKQTVTFSASDLELRAIYEMLKERFK